MEGGTVPGYGTRETVVAHRSTDGKHHTPIRSVFHRTDGGAVITVVTTYLAWNHSNVYNNRRMNLKLDPALFRPPPRRCEPELTGVLSKSLEQRNTLHFNPLHHPRVGGGKGGRGRTIRANESRIAFGPIRARAGLEVSGEGTASRGGGWWRTRTGVNPRRRGSRTGWTRRWRRRRTWTAFDTRLNADFVDFGGVVSSSTLKDSSRKGLRSGGESVAYNRDRGWVDAGIVDGIPASKDDGSGPAHEYALLGSGSDEL